MKKIKVDIALEVRSGSWLTPVSDFRPAELNENDAWMLEQFNNLGFRLMRKA